MNIWAHVRLAGAVVILIAAFIHRIDITLLGLLVQYIGIMGGLARAEQLIEALSEKINPEE